MEGLDVQRRLFNSSTVVRSMEVVQRGSINEGQSTEVSRSTKVAWQRLWSKEREHSFKEKEDALGF